MICVFLYTGTVNLIFTVFDVNVSGVKLPKFMFLLLTSCRMHTLEKSSGLESDCGIRTPYNLSNVYSIVNFECFINVKPEFD